MRVWSIYAGAPNESQASAECPNVRVPYHPSHEGHLVPKLQMERTEDREEREDWIRRKKKKSISIAFYLFNSWLTHQKCHGHCSQKMFVLMLQMEEYKQNTWMDEVE
jgi:hypothetical protein